MEPLLQVEHLSISFIQYDRGTRRRSLPVIRDLSFAIRPGQVTAVVGSSGSGKSLLAHGILGILPYNASLEGTITYGGEPLTRRRVEALRGREIVLVPQGVTYLDPLMEIGPQIRRGRRDDRARVESRAVLARYGLGAEVEGMYPFELSGGMARRALIAAAVVERPKLIIADEPTPGLDARAAGRILGHFRELAEEGAGVLLITHDITAALKCAHRVAVLYAGTIVEVARREAVAGEGEALRQPYTRALWRALPMNAFKGLPGTQPSHLAPEAGCPFAPRCPLKGERCGEMPPVTVWEGGEFRCWGKPPGSGRRR